MKSQFVELAKWATNGQGLRKYKVIQLEVLSAPAPLAGMPERKHVHAGGHPLCEDCYGERDAPQHFLGYYAQRDYDSFIGRQAGRLLEQQDTAREVAHALADKALEQQYAKVSG
jgi:hypothetical protein